MAPAKQNGVYNVGNQKVYFSVHGNTSMVYDFSSVLNNGNLTVYVKEKGREPASPSNAVKLFVVYAIGKNEQRITMGTEFNQGYTMAFETKKGYSIYRNGVRVSPKFARKDQIAKITDVPKFFAMYSMIPETDLVEVINTAEDSTLQFVPDAIIGAGDKPATVEDFKKVAENYVESPAVKAIKNIFGGIRDFFTK